MAVLVFGDFSERTTIVGLCIFGPFVPLTLFMLINSLRTKAKIISNEHEILLAIKNKENFIVWVYQHTMTTTQEHTNHKHKDYSLIMHKPNGKSLRFMIKEESQVHEMIDFISSKFPMAVVGFSEENRMEVSKIIGKEIKVSSL